MKLLMAVLDRRIYGLLALTWIGLTIAVSGFLSEATSFNVLQTASVTGLMAVGLTVVILTGQLDLSIGSILALSGIVVIELGHHVSAPLAMCAGPVAGIAMGLINGLLTTKAKINSFIVTLGTMIAFRGVGHLVTDSQPIAARDVTFGLHVDERLFWILTPRSLTLIVAALVLEAWLLFTPSGRRLFAVGGNSDAARLAGVAVDRCVVGAFVVSGLMSGIAGTLLALSLATGSPVVGQRDLVIVFAAVIIGGTSLAGGRGSTVRTLAGVLIVAGLSVGMDFRGVPFYYQSIVIGGILLLVVLADSGYEGYRARTARQREARTKRAMPRLRWAR